MARKKRRNGIHSYQFLLSIKPVPAAIIWSSRLSLVLWVLGILLLIVAAIIRYQ